MGATQTDSDSEIYYVRCIGDAGTIIGSRHYNPQESPTPVTVEEFQKDRKDYEHYEKYNVIAIDRPGDRLYTASKKRAGVERKRAEITGAEGRRPSKPIEIPLGGMPDTIREAAARSRMQASMMIGGEETGCIARKKDGEQCTKQRKSEQVICNIHIRQLEKGREVIDIYGNELTLDDIDRSLWEMN